jgi:hypothetical protein
VRSTRPCLFSVLPSVTPLARASSILNVATCAQTRAFSCVPAHFGKIDVFSNGHGFVAIAGLGLQAALCVRPCVSLPCGELLANGCVMWVISRAAHPPTFTHAHRDTDTQSHSRNNKHPTDLREVVPTGGKVAQGA